MVATAQAVVVMVAAAVVTAPVVVDTAAVAVPAVAVDTVVVAARVVVAAVTAVKPRHGLQSPVNHQGRASALFCLRYFLHSKL